MEFLLLNKYRCKIQKEIVSKEKYIDAAKMALINQFFFLYPTFAVFYYGFKYFNLGATSEVPTFFEILPSMVVIVVCEELHFYYS